jgi:nitrogen fixation NifU-like protein
MPGLEDLYREIILDHYRNPRNRGELETPPAHRVEGFNPLCGDEIVLYLDLDADGLITDIRISGQGCSISQSSASMMSAAVKGRTIAEVADITKALRGVVKFPVRIKCATLAWNTLAQGIEESTSESA